MKKQLIYLASPYSHKNPAVRQQRYHDVCQVAGILMQNGLFIFSPIASTHQICLQASFPFEFHFWKELDELMIDRCDAIVVLKLDGWTQSIGVNAEVFYGQKTKKDIYYLTPSEADTFHLKAGANLVWNKP